MNESKQQQREIRRREAIWHMYVHISWTMEEIAKIFQISRQNVKKILDQEAIKRKEDINNYYK